MCKIKKCRHVLQQNVLICDITFCVISEKGCISVKTASLSCSAAALGPEGVFEQNSLILEFLECQGILAVVQKCKIEGALDACDWSVGVGVRTWASRAVRSLRLGELEQGPGLSWYWLVWRGVDSPRFKGLQGADWRAEPLRLVGAPDLRLTQLCDVTLAPL